MNSPLLIAGAAIVAAAAISRAIPNSARSGRSAYTASNLGACFLIVLVVAVGAVLIYANRGH